ncbi:MAG: shikimate kinase [Ruminococcus sp.]|nr:shikimate kinase [Ruminococcus sp.]MCD7811175.1 shikimate kinase [Ruminococcus sp.]
MTIFLCGFMGCGKTTAGKIVAKKLGCGYADTDELIVRREKMTIPEIFAQKGEPYFRQAEAEVVKSLCGKNMVVSCGGGAMLNSETAAAAADGGIIVYLQTSFETCYNRIRNDKNRPIVQASTREQLRERYKSRHEIYKKNSSVTVSCNGTPAANAKAVIAAVKGYK